MALSTYSDLKSALLSWLGRPTDRIVPTGELIALFEADASRRLRTHFQETSALYSTVSGTDVYALPPTFLAPREVKITSVNPIKELTYLPSAQLDDIWARNTNGVPYNYTIEGMDIRFAPKPNTGYTIRLQYWQGIPPLSDESFGIDEIVIANGGTGYSEEDILIVSGGVPNLVALIQVDTVDEDGVILTAHPLQVGSYVSVPANPVAVSDGGVGDAATFTITWDNGGGQSNWLLTYYPDLYLFGSLAEAELFLGADTGNERYQMFVQRREASYEAVKQADLKFRIGGAPLTMRGDTQNP